MIHASTNSCAVLARSIAKGECSAAQVVLGYLARIRQLDPRLNALVHMNEAAAMEQAELADVRRTHGAPLGPLHGVPFTVKDSLDVAGLPTTAGAACFRERIAERDAPVVARLRAAGAILIGKTNLPALSEGFETDNSLFGRTSHPYDFARTPGGSSGGEAALIAAGGSPLGIGTDAAGSVRIPAHYCGLAALKPTSGRLPIDGHFPAAAGAVRARLQFGPMASHVEDVRLAFRVLVGHDSSDTAPAMRWAGPRCPLSVAFHTDNGIMSCTPETAAAVERAARALADAGARVDEIRPPVLGLTAEIMPCMFYGTDGGRSFRKYLAEVGMNELPALLELSLTRALAHEKSNEECEALRKSWHSLHAHLRRFMQRYDLILCPVATGPAPLHGATAREDPMQLFSYSMTFNLTMLPAVTVRAGTSPEGLPIGVQVVARPWREDVALSAAQAIETALGPWPQPRVAAQARDSESTF